MKLRVGTFCRFVYQGREYSGGEELEVPDDAVSSWLATGMVVPADGVWSEAVSADPGSPDRTPAEPAALVNADPDACGACEPPPRKAGKPYQVCTTPGCPCLTYGGKCPGCRRAHDRRRNATAHRRAYQSKEWRRTRREFLREHPLCECDDCAAIPAPLRPAAQVVDHVDALGPLGPRGHDWSNLRAMSKRCHDRRTMRDQVRNVDDDA
ncbi:HNH endonuclease signature motif containing protein [Streptomyces sp. enrichment culture]|uniref:HNH endonuclease signature motif containing protein n=1 Tax=Streptomyces sp. enrichment culture TaxID=1795815 RepID=UPI003F571587